MSYARFGDGSDVYVFVTFEAIECCFCRLQLRIWVDEPDDFLGGYFKDTGEKVQTEFTSNLGMIQHLEKHVAEGHVVPEEAFERLRDPEDEEWNLKLWSERKARG